MIADRMGAPLLEAFLAQRDPLDPLPEGWIFDDALFAEYIAFCRARYLEELAQARARYML
jgi:hypothetical protein